MSLHVNSLQLEDGGKAREADYCLQPMLWGFVPEWHRGAEPTKHGYSTNNARIEGVVESKLYRRAIGSGQRCVVICDGEAALVIQGDSSPQVRSFVAIRLACGPILLLPAAHVDRPGNSPN